MRLAILPNKVEYLAMKLFDVHVETEKGLRYILLKDGARVIPRPHVAIQDARDEAINMLLGPQVSQAIRASPQRKEEIQQAILATSCVTLEMTSKSQEDCVLDIILGEDEGVKIKKMLYEG